MKKIMPVLVFLLMSLCFLGNMENARATYFVEPPHDVPYTNNGYTYDTIIQIINTGNPPTYHAIQLVYYCQSSYFSIAKPVIYTSANPANAWSAMVAFKNTYYGFDDGVYYPSPGYPLTMGNTLNSNQDFCIIYQTTNAGSTWSMYTSSLNTGRSFGGGSDTFPYTDHVRSNVDLYWASQHFTPTNSYYNNEFSDGQTEKYQRLIIPASYFNGGGPPTQQLTITRDPQAGGGVISLPQGDGIYCGIDSYTICQLNFNLNSEVELEAYPNTGYAFSYWDDGTNHIAENPHTFTMDAAKTVTAVFKFNLSFPLLNYTPYTASVSAVFDHSATAGYTSDTDHHVTAFNGEVSDNQNPYAGTTCYPKTDNSAFGSGFNYDGISGAGIYYLCYDGHPGTDYPVANNTPVYAAADGIAHIPSNFPGYANAQAYNTVEIDHQNGYKTYYLHLYSQNVTENQQVYKGQTIIGYSGDIGASGAYHLHFEVQKDDVPVDPHGWTGSGNDPYTRTTNIILWE
jgi:murein DD-endopeptidase MepM/ murein hydrolase activator NlpD